MKGSIFNIQRFSINDGPGIRTTIFVKGCNLRCKWCHNPEGIDHKQQIQYFRQKCVMCGKCMKICPTDSHYVNESGEKLFDRSRCNNCGLCIENCLYDALIFCGKYMEVDEVVAEIKKDMDYYRNSGGGLTFSGGEPMLQKEFIKEVFDKTRALGIHNALDTAANVRWEDISYVLTSVDLVLLDLKVMDSNVHKKVTGVSNEMILENALKLSKEEVDIIVRIPVIPGINDTEDNMDKTAVFLKRFKRLLHVELLQISERCAHISEKPARTFHDALQLMWLIILPLMKVCGCGVFNFSRMDQYLYPFYKKDVESGILSEQQALELIEEFYHKNNDIMAPTDHMSQEIETTKYTIEVTYDDPNYLILGGLTKGNKPGVNELSFLFIEAAHQMKLRNPFIVVRHYKDIDSKFWMKVCDAIRDNATIVVYNDITMIPALLGNGVDTEDVMDYGFYGCNDPNIPAQEGGLRQLWFNLLRPLELALNSGEYPMQPKRDKPLKAITQYSLEDRMIGLMIGPYCGTKTTDIENISNMDELLEVYRQQVRFLLKDYRRGFEKDFALEQQCNAGRIRIEDCFLKGTIENAITWNNGGTKYHKLTLQGGGVASVVDSLAAIEELVFKNKEMSLKDLVKILNENYQGNEFLQARLHKEMPKFGNDIGWVDELANKVVNIFCDEVAGVNSPEYVYKFFTTLSTDRDFTIAGRDVGATPDGRFAGSKISENQSPTEGADVEGLTALLNSVSKIPFNRITGGPLNIRIHPSAVKGEKGLEAFASALSTYFNKGGLQAQINVVSKEQLLDAQKNPAKYTSLCVRVTGYSAYFVQMGKKAQDELISRSEKL